MKKTFTLLTVILFFVIQGANAQSFTLSTSAKAYTQLQNDIAITGTNLVAPIGFDFSINGMKKDSISINKSWGYFNLAGFSESKFHFYGTELLGGEYSYLLEGTPGSRIFKLQLKNAGFGHDFTQQDFINLQVWLYEADNSLELRFGPSRVFNMDFDFYHALGGPQVGFKNQLLGGTAGVPVQTASDTARIAGAPQNGKMYSFKIKNVGVAEYSSTPVKLYPNPAADNFYLCFEKEITCFELYDITGKVITAPYTNNGTVYSVNIDHLPPGIYTVKAFCNDSIYTEKLLVE